MVLDYGRVESRFRGCRERNPGGEKCRMKVREYLDLNAPAPH